MQVLASRAKALLAASSLSSLRQEQLFLKLGLSQMTDTSLNLAWVTSMRLILLSINHALLPRCLLC